MSNLENGAAIQEALLQKTGQRTVPNVFVNGEHVGGCDKTIEAHHNGRLQSLLNKSQAAPAQQAPEVPYDYDLIVIGGGSGGLAASKVRLMITLRCSLNNILSCR